MPLGQRQLFIYWRVARSDLPAAQQATRALQTQLQSRHPTLQCGLYLRDEPPQPDATLMETYAKPSTSPGDGVDSSLRREIAELAATALQPWLRGQRHVEVFQRCTD